MCRNIRTLFNFEPPADASEIEAAALQYVRKISGFNKPAKVNEQAFEAAISDVTQASQRLLDTLQTQAAPKNREIEREKAQARSRSRFQSRS